MNAMEEGTMKNTMRRNPTAVRCRSCFFFQAEDGIRDPLVTGVQTCALPISLPFGIARRWGYDKIELEHIKFGSVLERLPNGRVEMFRTRAGRVVELGAVLDEEIGRASCRERG